MNDIQFRKVIKDIKDNTIEQLDLSDKSLSFEQVKELVKTIVNNNYTLKALYVNDNNIGDEGMKEIAEVLAKSSPLAELGVRNNNIGFDGVVILSETLEKNTTLTKLYMGDNNIGDNGAKRLSEALEKNTTLTLLDIANNGIRDGGAKAIAKALESNSGLSELGIYENSIGNEGITAFVQALERNSTMTELELGTNYDSDDDDDDNNNDNIDGNIYRDPYENISYYSDNDTRGKIYFLLQQNKNITGEVRTAFNKLLELIKEKEQEYSLERVGDNEKLLINNVSLEDYNTVVYHSREVISILLKKAQAKGELEGITLEEFYHKLRLVKDFSELEMELFDLLGIPTHNAAVSYWNKDAEEYSQLYTLFESKDSMEVQAMLESLKSDYKISQTNDEQLAGLWNRFIDYAGEKLSWSQSKITSLKGLDSIKTDSEALEFVKKEHNIKNENTDLDILKKELKGAILFHSIYPEYRKNIALTIEDFNEEIKQGILACKVSAKALTLIKNLSQAILPQATQALVNDMLNDIYKNEPSLLARLKQFEETLEKNALEALKNNGSIVAAQEVEGSIISQAADEKGLENNTLSNIEDFSPSYDTVGALISLGETTNTQL